MGIFRKTEGNQPQNTPVNTAELDGLPVHLLYEKLKHYEALKEYHHCKVIAEIITTKTFRFMEIYS